MQKTKKRIFASAIVAVLALLMVFASVGTLSASAASTTTAKYTTYGNYNDGETTKSGYPTNFKVIMHGSSTSGTGTIYNDKHNTYGCIL